MFLKSFLFKSSGDLLPRCIVFAALALAASCSFAQEELPPLVVTSEIREEPTPVRVAPAPSPAPQPAPLPPLILDDLAPQAVSLTVPDIAQAREALISQPGGTAMIDSEDYKRGRATNIKDALDYAPGVFVQPRFGSSESRLSIRGSGIQRTFHGRGIKLLQDGVPLNLADGGFDFQAIEPLAAQYIEVYRGANALEYGGTTLGGAVNFISHTGHTAAPLQTRFEYGSFNSLRGQISSGIVAEDQDAYVSFTHSSTDGFRDHSEQENQRLFANLGWQIRPDVETRFYITYSHAESELPGELTKAEMLADPTQAARVPATLRGIQPVARFDHVTSDWRRDIEVFRLANKTTWKGDDQEISLSTFWSHTELDHPILFVIDQVTDDFGLNLRYDNVRDLFGKENHFILGFAPTFGTIEDARFDNNFGERGAQFSDSHQTAVNADFYTQNSHYFIPDLALVTGAQFSYAKRKNRDDFPVGPLDPDNSDTQDWNAFLPKLGLLWDVAPEAQVFANVSRSFEPASFGELVNANNGGAGLIPLDAQTATTFEIGTRGAREKISWDLAYYTALVEDELLSYEVQPGLSQTVNADDTIHQGVEASFNIELFSGLFAKSSGASSQTGGKSLAGKAPIEPWEDKVVFRQNYLWNDFRFDDDAGFGDNRLPGIPPHYYRAELLYEHPSGVYAGPNLEWIPEGYNVDSAETEFADSYALLGFKVGYRTEKGLSIFVEAKNLTDKTYAATTSVVDTYTGGGIYLPGDGRSVYAGVEWKW